MLPRLKKLHRLLPGPLLLHLKLADLHRGVPVQEAGRVRRPVAAVVYRILLLVVVLLGRLLPVFSEREQLALSYQIFYALVIINILVLKCKDCLF